MVDFIIKANALAASDESHTARVAFVDVDNMDYRTCLTDLVAHSYMGTVLPVGHNDLPKLLRLYIQCMTCAKPLQSVEQLWGKLEEKEEEEVGSHDQ